MAQIDALLRANIFSFDSMGRKVSHTCQILLSETFVYDFDGNMTRSSNFNGDAIYYQYDTLNRLTNRYDSGGTVQDAFTYTATGQRASMTDTSGESDFLCLR